MHVSATPRSQQHPRRSKEHRRVSDLQELIHTNAHNAYAIGVKAEHDRIVKIIKESKTITSDQVFFLLKAIREKQNERI